MKKCFITAMILLFLGTACSHVSSATHKRWETNLNTIYLKNLSVKKDDAVDPGFELKLALEEVLQDSLYIVAVDPEDAKFQLKYKITRFNAGSRLKRFFTFGIDDGSRAMMVVKVALYNDEGMLGAWEITSDVKGGPVGGSTQILYNKTAHNILQHLRGY